jgi:hypothetical protein
MSNGVTDGVALVSDQGVGEGIVGDGVGGAG